MLGIPNDMALLLLAVLLDLAVGELPDRLHPTVWMGKTVSWTEKLAPKGRRSQLVYGAGIALLIPVFWGGLAYLAADGLQRLHEVSYILAGAALLKPTFSVRMLFQVARWLRTLIAAGAIDEVRANMPSLVSRNVDEFTLEQATAATVESVSENLTDSIIGPWLAFALFGLPGAFAYRAVNTLDSMIGYHGRYEFLGKASARLDDLVNLIPARLTALLLVLASFFLPGQRAAGAWRITRRDHARTASPNAGWTMSAMAGALGVALEKTGYYRLGDATRALQPEDITRALQSMALVAAFGLAFAIGLIYLRDWLF